MKLTVLSSYPEKGLIHPTKTVGGAYYTKGILTALQSIHPEMSITVLGEQLGKKEAYQENSITVSRVWKRNSLLSLWQAFFTLTSKEAEKVLISFEVNMYGNLSMSLTVCFQLLLLKLMGKNPCLVMQHVLSSFDSLEKNPLKRILLDGTRKLFYQFLLLSTHRIIVFEEQFKNVISANNKRIVVIPLFVPQATRGDRDKASKAIGVSPDTFHVLYFGFLSPYKGIDWLVDAWPNIPNTTLIVAGGPNPNHKNNPSYMTFVNNVLRKAQEKGIKTTGFVQEKDMANYFNAADVLILPYTTFFSSSGPLSLAYAYEKGFIFSKELKKYAHSEDFKNSLEETNISLESMSFDYNKIDLEKTVLWSRKNLDKLTKFSQTMKQKRDPEIIAEMLYQSILN